jgi:hypothetical protein
MNENDAGISMPQAFLSDFVLSGGKQTGDCVESATFQLAFLLFQTPAFRTVLHATMIDDKTVEGGPPRHAAEAALALKNKRYRRYRNYGILLVTFAAYMAVCSLFYTYYENWEPSISMAFVVETMTTVG